MMPSPLEFVRSNYIRLLHYISPHSLRNLCRHWPSLILHPGSAQLQELSKIRCSNTSSRIPTLCSIPACARDDWATIWLGVKSGVSIASRRCTMHNIVKSNMSNGVDPRVQKSKGRKLGRQARSVKERDYTSCCGRGA